MSDKINANAPGYDAATPEIYYEQLIAELEKQLAERDEELARCVEGIKKIRHDNSFEGGGNRDKALDYFCRDLLASLPTSAQATAKVLAAARRLVERGFAYTSDFRDLEEAIREEQAYRSSDNS